MRRPRIKAVSVNNRKKQMIVKYTSGRRVTLHYGQFGISDNIASARPDRETRGRSIILSYADGTEDYMPYDQPLAVTKDPEYLLRHHMEVLIARIRKQLRERSISLRYLAEHLGTSDNQIQRLLNPNILNKNLTQLYQIAALCGLSVEVRLTDAA